MLNVDELLGAALPWELVARVVPEQTEPITHVVLLEHLGHLEAVQRGALVVLTRSTVEPAGGYQLDVLVRSRCHDRAFMIESTQKEIPLD